MPIPLAYENLGQGDPLLILHGLFGSKRNWLSIAKPLSEFVQVIAVDLRNHGNSGHATTMSYPEMAEDVIQLANQLHLEQFTLAGHSMGGKVAMTAALHHPDRIRRMMVLDIAPVPYDSGFARYLDVMQTMPLDRIASRKEAEQHLATVIENDLVRQFLLQNLVRDQGAFRWRINLQAIGDNLPEIAGFPEVDAGTTYTGPSLFVSGGRAEYLTPAHEPVIRRYFPGAELHIIKNAGHWLHVEEAAAVLEGFRRLLDR
ncbi:MAG: alpha/beta fold hydrolase [Gammaproteobacteria bacterium]|nr:alpha/beta fold hydrolase [Gammaproteobacteria bacterium]